MVKINEKELKELFMQLKYNDKIAFEKMYSKYNNLVYGIAFSILKNKQDSEDVVQTVFTKIYEMDKSKLPTDKETSWIYTTTKNQAITLLRKKNNNLDIECLYEVEDKNNEINNVIDKDSYNRLISKLNNKEKEIVSLKILANLSFEQIGKLLNVPTGTIKWRYYKSINTLKLMLSNLGMFIITFVIGVKALSNNKKQNKVEQEIVQDENIKENSTTNRIEESVIQETNKAGTNEEYKDTILDKNELSGEGKQEITQETLQRTETSNIDYLGISILSISALFLIFTITFSIILAKHQLKRKKKRLNNGKVRWY